MRAVAYLFALTIAWRALRREEKVLRWRDGGPFGLGGHVIAERDVQLFFANEGRIWGQGQT